MSFISWRTWLVFDRSRGESWSMCHLWSTKRLEKCLAGGEQEARSLRWSKDHASRSPNWLISRFQKENTSYSIHPSRRQMLQSQYIVESVAGWLSMLGQWVFDGEIRLYDTCGRSKQYFAKSVKRLCIQGIFAIVGFLEAGVGDTCKSSRSEIIPGKY